MIATCLCFYVLLSFSPCGKVLTTIDEIETHFRKVGLTAVRIGQSLSSTESQRCKAEHANNLLEYFVTFQKLNVEEMRKEGGERVSHLFMSLYIYLSGLMSGLVLVKLTGGDDGH